MTNLRLGDVIDDYCSKCRRLTNHAIVSIVNDEPAKVRCRSCYHDHDYLREQVPPSKKDLKKMELFNSVLAGVKPAAEGEAAEVPEEVLQDQEELAPAAAEAPQPPAPAPKKGRTTKSKKA